MADLLVVATRSGERLHVPHELTRAASWSARSAPPSISSSATTSAPQRGSTEAVRVSDLAP